MQSKFFRWFAGMSCMSLSVLVAQSAHAQIKVGVTISTTGPAAAIGAPTRNAMLLWPKEVAGQKVEYIILDDASDTTNAVRNLRKLTTEEKVDIVVGPNTTLIRNQEQRHAGHAGEPAEEFRLHGGSCSCVRGRFSG
ncbi:MAG: ABC transporter substrate-binding protein [Burkholderiaceae bacterium]